jgi:signal transduction histidine kinase
MRKAEAFLPYTFKSLPWGFPFAVFFWLLNGAHAGFFLSFLGVAVIFTVVIRTALWMTQAWVMPRIYAGRDSDDIHWLVPGALYGTAGMTGALLSSQIANMIFWRDFTIGPRAWLVTGLFSLIFSIMFGGIAYAQAFQRQAEERGAQVERIRAELARAELRALRAQVNPHFLFNTLNSIAALIAEDPHAAEDVVTRLADVFRYALTSTEADTVRLGDELAFVRSYLAIEQVRLADRLRIDEQIAPGLDRTFVPPLLLQPLVENAVRYAIAPRTQGGTITICARRDGDSLVLVVADDGPGFTPGGLPQGHGVGLESVRERLRLAGTGHSLQLDTAPGQGTRITITLPADLQPSPQLEAPKEAPSC